MVVIVVTIIAVVVLIIGAFFFLKGLQKLRGITKLKKDPSYDRGKVRRFRADSVVLFVIGLVVVILGLLLI